MTTFYQPLQRQSDGRWDMTSSTGSTPARAIGYCAGWPEENPWRREGAGRHGKFDAGPEYVERMAKSWDVWLEGLLPHRDRFHDDGHETGEGAYRCWRRYQVDVNLEWGDDPNRQVRCVADGCEAWTTGLGTFRGGSLMPPIPACPEHQTPEVAMAYLEKGRG